MAKFKYRMQNILDVKTKLETQAKNEYAVANQKYLSEQEKLSQLVLRRVDYEENLKKLLSDKINVVKISNARKDVNTMKTIIRSQMFEVKKAQDELEIKRKLLSDVIQGETVEQIQNSVSAILQSDYEKLKEKAFEDFQKKLKATEAKEIDELVSFTYNN